MQAAALRATSRTSQHRTKRPLRMKRRVQERVVEAGRRRRLADLFHQMDINQDRVLSQDEVNLFLMSSGYDPGAIIVSISQASVYL
ncbi:unnamed protein product [Protopolystoma xenopodis]|uniref:EF-hand domain-containing protein n=1 Tax=Protopolystoma xenopodis TaxID=117903 RepID=A0A3S5A3E9_9PLAT|nr:unnamed protein product [Protopolystoma xenopodis]